MRHVEMDILVPGGDSGSVFERISDFPRYADYTDAVREVRIDSIDGDMTTSTWSVNFRNGVLCWRERDRIDSAARQIEFEQLDGDFAQFSGTWQVAALGADVTVRFTAEFDLGMPSLAAIIEPIAEEALRDNMWSILCGLLGSGIVLRDANAVSATQ